MWDSAAAISFPVGMLTALLAIPVLISTLNRYKSLTVQITKVIASWKKGVYGNRMRNSPGGML